MGERGAGRPAWSGSLGGPARSGCPGLAGGPPRASRPAAGPAIRAASPSPRAKLAKFLPKFPRRFSGPREGLRGPGGWWGEAVRSGAALEAAAPRLLGYSGSGFLVRDKPLPVRTPGHALGRPRGC